MRWNEPLGGQGLDWLRCLGSQLILFLVSGVGVYFKAPHSFSGGMVFLSVSGAVAGLQVHVECFSGDQEPQSHKGSISEICSPSVLTG